MKKIVLMGYMGCGKSTVGKVLAEKLLKPFIDLDTYIEKKYDQHISNIFSSKGEIYFRNIESASLKELLDNKAETVIALGGGTPCYGNNLKTLIEDKSILTIYLKCSLPSLTTRLFKEKLKRPLINWVETEDEMGEFIGKHLFERSHFYSQSDIIISCDDFSVEEIVEKIVASLYK